MLSKGLSQCQAAIGPFLIWMTPVVLDCFALLATSSFILGVFVSLFQLIRSCFLIQILNARYDFHCLGCLVCGWSVLGCVGSSSMWFVRGRRVLGTKRSFSDTWPAWVASSLAGRLLVRTSCCRLRELVSSTVRISGSNPSCFPMTALLNHGLSWSIPEKQVDTIYDREKESQKGYYISQLVVCDLASPATSWVA